MYHQKKIKGNSSAQICAETSAVQANICGMFTRLFKSIIISTRLQLIMRSSIVCQKVSKLYFTYHFKFGDMGSLMIWVNLEKLFTVGIDAAIVAQVASTSSSFDAAIVVQVASTSASFDGRAWSHPMEIRMNSVRRYSVYSPGSSISY